MIGGFRFVRRLVLFFAIIGLLFVGANLVAARIAENKIAEAAQREFDLPARPVIHLGGFPIILNVLRGKLPSASFEATDVTVQGLTIHKVDIVLKEIRTHGFLGPSVSVTVGSGSMSATVTQDALNAYLRRRGENTTVTLRAGNIASVRTVRDGIVFAGTGTVRLLAGGTSIEFAPSSVTMDGRPPPPGFEQSARRRGTVRVAIPSLPGGIKVSGLVTSKGNVRFTATLRNRTLTLQK